MSTSNKELNGVHFNKLERFSFNPFIGDDAFIIKKKNKTILAGTTKDILVDSETGEVRQATLFAKKKLIDAENFVKLYLTEIKNFFELSNKGIKALSYLTTILPINKDLVYIHIPDLMEFCGFKSKETAYRAIKELIINKVIAISNKANLFYLNPKIMFNGDRIIFMNEYQIRDKKDIPGTQLQIED